MNIDFNIHSDQPYVLHDSNIVHHQKQVGGVGANIAQNLANFGMDVSFLTMFSIDALGIFAKQTLTHKGILIDHCDTMSLPSNMYMAIFDQQRDLYLGLNDMPLVDEMTPRWIKTKYQYITSFDAIVLDNNLPQKTIEYLVKTYSSKRIYIDAVSGVKAPKLVNIINQVYVIKMNHAEFEILFPKETVPPKTMLLVSNGSQKITLYQGDNIVHQTPETIEHPISTSGAGDALFSGFIYGLESQYSLPTSLSIGAYAAYKTIHVKSSINHEVNINEFLHRIK
ncbi:PfkB family carbohydrate kinase [Candidatus Xianfuyuplasma coldseepsis]|uniref:PfkB family carbohydrate kinase n=1 Tax=Candidatus Xianfuyuplasma coldseepsis TaxID=2782163 RepID=UPI00216309F5|nr:PfkB family carbohydrate kinase [Xianfuyuplasma coldseepsis]